MKIRTFSSSPDVVAIEFDKKEDVGIFHDPKSGWVINLNRKLADELLGQLLTLINPKAPFIG